VAESDWFAPERHIEIVDMILAVGFLICLAGYSPAVPEAKFGEARLLLIVVFGAPVHMLPPLFHGDAKAFC
jgi:hypothetical protein